MKILIVFQIVFHLAADKELGMVFPVFASFRVAIFDKALSRMTFSKIRLFFL